jgi:DNA-binding GntR family transcriptional regulator
MTPSTSELLTTIRRQLESEAALLAAPRDRLSPQQRAALEEIEGRLRALERALDPE